MLVSVRILPSQYFIKVHARPPAGRPQFAAFAPVAGLHIGGHPDYGFKTLYWFTEGAHLAFSVSLFAA